MKPAPVSLRAALRKKKPVPPVPKGWSRIDDIAKAENVSMATARLMIRESLAAGLLEKKPWPMLDAVGRVLNYPIYRRTDS
jgi:predicted transcriptional regulator